MKICSHCKTCLDDNATVCPLDGAPLTQPFHGASLIDGKYLIERCLGQGGMGAVYLARHKGLDKSFALKLINASSPDRKGFAQRFSVEAKAMGKLKHPNIVGVTDYGVDPRANGLPYLVMEYLEGETLREKLKSSSKVPLSEKLRILDQTAEGIDYAHRNGILHCDLKPENIFFSKNDYTGGGQVKILDFGLARLLRPTDHRESGHDSQVTTADTPVVESGNVIAGKIQLSEAETITEGEQCPMGTPAYMAPEVINNQEPGSHSDLYSFGILAYELLVGRPPFSGKSGDVLRAHLLNQPPKPSRFCREIAPEIETAILKPLDKAPKERPGTARDIVRMIRNAGLQYERRKFRTLEIPRRAAIAVILAPLMAAVWFLVSLSGFVSDLENKTIDARFALSESRLPDPRILIATFDDETLEADKVPLANKADEVAEVLEDVFAAGAAGVAIDFLLPYSWSRSQAFSRLVLENGDRLTLAAFASPSGEIIGKECLTGLTSVALGPSRVRSLFGLVNLQEDSDGMVRRARMAYPDIAGSKWDSWAVKAADSLVDRKDLIQITDDKAEVWIDFSLDWRQIERVSWKDMRKRLSNDPMFFKDRLLLLGGDYIANGDDFHRVPASAGLPGRVSGVVLQALTVNTLLSGLPLRHMRTAYGLVLVVFLSFIVLFAAMCIRRMSFAAALGAGAVIVLTIAAFAIFRWMQVTVPLSGPVAIVLLAFCTAVVLRSKLTPFPLPEVKGQ